MAVKMVEQTFDLEENFPGDQNGLLLKTSYSGSST